MSYFTIYNPPTLTILTADQLNYTESVLCRNVSQNYFIKISNRTLAHCKMSLKCEFFSIDYIIYMLRNQEVLVVNVSGIIKITVFPKQSITHIMILTDTPKPFVRITSADCQPISDRKTIKMLTAITS